MIQINKQIKNKNKKSNEVNYCKIYSISKALKYFITYGNITINISYKVVFSQERTSTQ